MFIIIPLLLYLLLVLAYASPTPSQCSNHYSINNLPPECSDNSCNITEGLDDLITNFTIQNKIVLCLVLPGFTMNINTQNYVQEIESVYIESESINVQGNYSLICSSQLIVQVQTAFIKNTNFTGQKIWLRAKESIQIEYAFIFNESALQTACNCYNQKGSCDQFKFKYPNLYIDGFFNDSSLDQLQPSLIVQNSLTLITNTLDVLLSTFKYSVIGLLSETVNIQNSTISSTGLGFKSDSGQGCGYFDEVLNQLLGCMGSGGSHGGFGGNSYPQNCYLLVSRHPYGSIERPFQPGSGGGFFLRTNKQTSSGGGVINIQARYLTIMQSNIKSEGKNGIQGGGGGAGGSIILDYQYISSNSNISVAGGNGEKSSSGAGGRIRLWNYNWENETLKEGKSGLIIQVQGGSNCPGKLSCGENGSVYTSPCKPGFYLQYPNYICTQCPIGYYQIGYSYSACIPCNLKPANSEYIEFTGEYYYSSACNYTCNDGYQLRDQKCLSEFDLIVDSFGGQKTLICFGIVVASVLIFCFILIYKKLSESENILSFDQKHTDTMSHAKYFRIQDLPYHEHRLYLSGDNSIFSPWKLSEKSKATFNSEMKNPVTKVNHYLQKIFQQITIKSQYSKVEKCVLIATKFTYYAFARIIRTYFRTKKAKSILRQVSLINKKIPDFESVGVKFHVKKQMTVGSIQIFNHTKSVYDFYIENYFPLYLLLEKAPIKGYIIDFVDPFLKVFINQMSQKEQNNSQKNIEQFLKQTNRLLKNPEEILPLLNHLWSINQILPRVQIYLWQPPNIVLGIDNEYTIDQQKQLFLLISSDKFNNKHFIFDEELPSMHLHEIEYLKNKFNIRKESLNAEPKTSFWTIHNSFAQRTLLWIIGAITTVNLVLSIISYFAVIFLTLQQKQTSFMYGIVFFFIIEPFSEFGANFTSFKTILGKDQHMLANSIYFTITTLVKFLILVIFLLAYNLSATDEGQLLNATLYIWLLIFLTSAMMLVSLLMFRVRIFSDN